MNRHQQLRKRVELQARRMKKAEHEHSSLISQTVYIGTLGLVFVLPVVIGAYFGSWLDSLVEGYSIRWTISMFFLGFIIGGVNVYLLIRE